MLRSHPFLTVNSTCLLSLVLSFCFSWIAVSLGCFNVLRLVLTVRLGFYCVVWKSRRGGAAIEEIS